MDHSECPAQYDGIKGMNGWLPIRLTLAPGGATYPDLPHEGEEFGYVLQGSVKIHVGNKVYKAKKGESFYFTPHAKHYIEASSSSGARLIWVSTPPSF